ncbi:MAG: hypothetical protein N2Z79_04870 [Candidatus Omnitrophica bacterium]|nr:hypothetical protein [Candidatus Omnitrophota bacterium]
MRNNQEIILGVCGSVAIYKALEVIRRLREEGFLITVIMTKEAQELIRPLLFQNLSQNKVYTDLFSLPEAWEIQHVSLAEKADLILVLPATANIIAKVASGLCDDLLSCVILATKAEVLFCPAMNENMYKNKITQENIKKLKKIGYKFVEPIKGRLACGKIGFGHLADIETIIKEVKNILNKNLAR